MANDISKYDLAGLINYAGYQPEEVAAEVWRRTKSATKPVSDLLRNTRKYWIDEPNRIAYDAQERAANEFGVNATEWNKSDAVKHMVWQNELARRTMLPQAIAGKLANLVGIGKELGDQFYLKGGERLNSSMDTLNNVYGANQIPLEGDNVEAAIRAARMAPKSMKDSILYGLPYARD